MKKFINSIKSAKGFTLIELLVVIGILGVLAAALVATIDPFEQLKKAQDANTQNTAVEFVDANIRYYTTHNAMPWVNDTAGCGTEYVAGTAVSLSSMPACLNDLIQDGELKSGFTTITNTLAEIFVSGTDNTVVACFTPLSLAENHDAYTKDNSTGGAQSGCPTSAGVNSSCFWCAQ